jgi:hypothetical protein
MHRAKPLLILALLASATTLAPTAAAQVPDNPFDDFACAPPSGSGAIGYARTLVWLACFAALYAGSATYEFACFVTGAC